MVDLQIRCESHNVREVIECMASYVSKMFTRNNKIHLIYVRFAFVTCLYTSANYLSSLH